MTIETMSLIIIQTLADNFGALLIIIATGAGIKIVLDIIFTSLYSVTTRGK